MTRKLTFNRIGTTEDTGDPVIRAQFEDSKSHLDVIILQDEEVIRIWNVQSNVKGDMKRILDEITKQLNFNDVHFLEPDVSEELYGTHIQEVLDGFERKEEIVGQNSDGQPIKSTYLEGVWEHES